MIGAAWNSLAKFRNAKLQVASEQETGGIQAIQFISQYFLYQRMHTLPTLTSLSAAGRRPMGSHSMQGSGCCTGLGTRI